MYFGTIQFIVLSVSIQHYENVKFNFMCRNLLCKIKNNNFVCDENLHNKQDTCNNDTQS